MMIHNTNAITDRISPCLSGVRAPAHPAACARSLRRQSAEDEEEEADPLSWRWGEGAGFKYCIQGRGDPDYGWRV